MNSLSFKHPNSIILDAFLHLIIQWWYSAILNIQNHYNKFIILIYYLNSENLISKLIFVRINTLNFWKQISFTLLKTTSASSFNTGSNKRFHFHKHVSCFIASFVEWGSSILFKDQKGHFWIVEYVININWVYENCSLVSS